jgi:hypothetical protein
VSVEQDECLNCNDFCPTKVPLTLCHSYVNPYCLGRKTAFFRGHLHLLEKPETGIPYREKIITIKLKKTK